MGPLVSIILFALAGACNAVMDTVTHHYQKSIFNVRKYRMFWWNPEYSWRNKYHSGDPALGRRKWIFGINYPVQISDAWHLFKTVMIFGIVGSVVSYQPIYQWWADIIIFGTAWNLTFSLFYNKLLIKS